MIVSKTRNAPAWATKADNLIPNGVKCNENVIWVAVLRLHMPCLYCGFTTCQAFLQSRYQCAVHMPCLYYGFTTCQAFLQSRYQCAMHMPCLYYGFTTCQAFPQSRYQCAVHTPCRSIAFKHGLKSQTMTMSYVFGQNVGNTKWK